VAGLGLIHSLYRAHRAVVPVTAWHLVFHRGMLYSLYLWFWKTFSYFSVLRSMFLFLRKYGVEMSRAESPVSSYTCADLAAPNWRRRIGGAELSHSVAQVP